MRSLFLLGLILLGGCSSVDLPPTFTVTAYAKYEVLTGGCTADITYVNSGGGTEQKQDVPSGWTASFVAERGMFLYLSAQNCSRGGGIQTNLYFKDGDEDWRLYRTSTSEGAFVIASVSATR